MFSQSLVKFQIINKIQMGITWVQIFAAFKNHSPHYIEIYRCQRRLKFSFIKTVILPPLKYASLALVHAQPTTSSDVDISLRSWKVGPTSSWEVILSWVFVSEFFDNRAKIDGWFRFVQPTMRLPVSGNILEPMIFRMVWLNQFCELYIIVAIIEIIREHLVDRLNMGQIMDISTRWRNQNS